MRLSENFLKAIIRQFQENLIGIGDDAFGVSLADNYLILSECSLNSCQALASTHRSPAAAPAAATMLGAAGALFEEELIFQSDMLHQIIA